MRSPLLHTTKGWLALAAVAVVPLLYSGSYLSAFWNPYGHLNDLPLAIVNEDHGYHGQHEGQKFIDSLPKNWHTKILSASQMNHAKNLLQSGKVDMIITIPPDYTRDLLRDKAPTLNYAVDPGTNYLTGILMTREADSITQDVTSQIQTNIAHQEEHAMNGLQQGAVKLHAGTQALVQHVPGLIQGGQAINQGVTQLTTASQKLAQGTHAVYTGFAQLSQGMNQLAIQSGLFSQNMDDVAQHTHQLSTGLMQEQQGLDTFLGSFNQLAQGSTTLANDATKLSQGASRLPQVLNQQQMLIAKAQNLAEEAQHNPADLSELEGILNQLSASSSQITQLSTTLATQNSQLSQGLNTLSSQSQQLSDASNTLKQSAATLTQGAASLSTATTRLAQGAHTLDQANQKLGSGSQQLQSSLSQLAQGSTFMNHSLASLGSHLNQYTHAVNQFTSPLPSISHNLSKLAQGLEQTQKPLNWASQPISAHITNIGGAGNYGTGLSPYFLALSLWVGALVVTVLVPGGDKKGLGTRQWVSLGLAFAQIVILTTGILWLLPLNPQYTLTFWGIMTLVGLTWWAVMRLLVEKFGDGGRLFAIVLLVIQLSGSAGTYPIQLSPHFFAVIHPYLPMTWAIHVMRYALSGSYRTVLMPDIIRLTLTFLVAWIIVRFVPGRLAFDAPPLASPESLDAQQPSPSTSLSL
ncbi:YhgE/Pip domain-containing protein [Sulfobacillus thermosulfidooxidans]|uniref:YhgE/Pip domain-containing protein n=1 Tax=Sulfobacillus thermosulfidooxidans TaxID=28034 RepID=UPI0006B45501|nr:YhgE/Pip domain-containing protein [Sulfobacillus thermosulfidooxidans]